VKLRDVINEVTDWWVAIHIATTTAQISWDDALVKREQIRKHVRTWIGEDLLEREL
jgi:hypothetical protein